MYILKKKDENMKFRARRYLINSRKKLFKNEI